MIGKKSKIYLAGHDGMLGSNIMNFLQQEGYLNIISRTRQELNLINQKETELFFEKETPDYVIMAAGKVGGIKANMEHSAEFLYENLMIVSNVINSAHKYKVKKLVFLGTSSVYPKDANQPFKETSLLTGPFESTNEPYSIAKVVGIKLCQYYNKQYGDNFYTIMPANLYGFYDHFEPEKSHVIPGLIYKLNEAKKQGLKEVLLWGTGNPLREFLYAKDLAEGIVFLLNKVNANTIYKKGVPVLNIGGIEEITIKKLASKISKIVGFEGDIKFDINMPDGIKRKRMDSNILHSMGWKPYTKIEEGISQTYQWYLKQNIIVST